MVSPVPGGPLFAGDSVFQPLDTGVMPKKTSVLDVTHPSAWLSKDTTASLKLDHVRGRLLALVRVDGHGEKRKRNKRRHEQDSRVFPHADPR